MEPLAITIAVVGLVVLAYFCGIADGRHQGRQLERAEHRCGEFPITIEASVLDEARRRRGAEISE